MAIANALFISIFTHSQKYKKRIFTNIFFSLARSTPALYHATPELNSDLSNGERKDGA